MQDDPILRDVRRLDPDLGRTATLTKFGKLQRFGPGWWIDHSTTLTAEKTAITEQVRGIRQSDPSQAVDEP